jgi:dihydrofolate reductase
MGVAACRGVSRHVSQRYLLTSPGYPVPMRRVIYYITLTADGMYADQDGGLAGFDPSEDEHRYANRLMDSAGDVVMGRVMYDLMEYWDDVDVDDPTVPDVEREFATFWRATPKRVASHGQPTLRSNATRIDGDVIDYVRALKSTDGPDIMLGCGADLFADLSTAGLIDEYRFRITPMALGHGKALFARLGQPLRLRLTNATRSSGGGILVEYVPSS